MPISLLKNNHSITVQLCERFKLEIESGRYAEDKPLPAFGVLAESYGISKSTVHEAFKQLAKEDYLFIKHGKGAFANPEKIRREVQGKLRSVGVVAFNVFSSNDNYMIPLLESINESALKKKIRLDFQLIQGMSLSDDANKSIRSSIAEGRFDGLILASPLNVEDLAWLGSHRIPFVAATSRYAIPVPQVLLDNRLAAQLALDIYVKRKARHIAVFLGPLSWARKHITPYSKEIAEVFTTEGEEKGLTISLVSCNYSYSDAKQKAIAFFKHAETVDGCFFQADIITKGVLSALKQEKINISKLVLVNYCDLEDYLVSLNIQKPLVDMGREAFALLETLRQGRELDAPVVVKPRLINEEV